MSEVENIFEEGELVIDSVVANFATTAADGKTYQVEYYNLDVIISVGYRIKSVRGTHFRIWASGILKEDMFLNIPFLVTDCQCFWLSLDDGGKKCLQSANFLNQEQYETGRLHYP